MVQASTAKFLVETALVRLLYFVLFVMGAAAVRSNAREEVQAAPATTGAHRQCGPEAKYEGTTAEEAWGRLAAGLRAKEASMAGQRRAAAVETNSTEEIREDVGIVSQQ